MLQSEPALVLQSETAQVIQFEPPHRISPPPCLSKSVGEFLSWRHRGNRHAERDLRQLRAGLQMLQTMSRNLKAQIEYEVTRAEGERSRVSLAEMNTANDAVLARMTAICEQVNQRIHELSNYSIPVPQDSGLRPTLDSRCKGV